MSDERRLARCNSCEAPIRWTITEKHGKRMPVDAEPVKAARGFRLLDGRDVGDGETLVARFITKPEIGERLFQSHFATCPNATQHRRKS